MMVVLIKYDWSTLIKSSIVSTLVWVNSWNSPNVELKRILQWNRTTNANKNHQRIQNTYTSDKHHYASLYIIVTNLIHANSSLSATPLLLELRALPTVLHQGLQGRARLRAHHRGLWEALRRVVALKKETLRCPAVHGMSWYPTSSKLC